MINVHWNGSKFAGEEPDSVDELLRVLAEHTLDPTFEKYGNFAENQADGVVLFWGNFYDLSHGFSVETDERELIERLTGAIRANQETAAYKEAREVRRQEDEDRKRRETALLARWRS